MASQKTSPQFGQPVRVQTAFYPIFFNLQETYSTFPYSMMTIFVMTLGELNYADTFMPWGKLEYATLTNILFFLFVLGMPIILMNMLVRNIPR